MNEVIEGIERAEEHANPAWKAQALKVVSDLAHKQLELTTDDVWEELKNLPETTRNASALGPVMLRARKAGLIERTALFRDSQRKNLTGRAGYGKPIRVWQSRVLEQ
jgi:hypothetical protein